MGGGLCLCLTLAVAVAVALTLALTLALNSAAARGELVLDLAASRRRCRRRDATCAASGR